MTTNLTNGQSLGSSYDAIRVKAFNDSIGHETSCPLCKGKGMIARVDECGNFAVRYCECMQRKLTLERLERNGLLCLYRDSSLDNYIAQDLWQKDILAGARRYVVDSEDGKWFYVGGQVGSGKTHICTGIVRELVDKGMDAMYMTWRDDGTRLKAMITDSEAYDRKMARYKTCGLLYIDDFFKTEQGKLPTPADVNLAFEIINYRYVNRLQTLFSSERPVRDILAIDEAVGSRIWERTKGFCFTIGKDRSKNYRLRGVQ